jgi:hypothetical protein
MNNITKHQIKCTLLKPAFIVGFFLASFLFLVPVSHAATYISGIIDSDTEWTVDGSPYVVGNTTVAPDITLTIDPGVVVKFISDAAISVGGSIHADGTSINPIYFTSFKDDTVGGDTNEDGTSTSPAPGDWDGFILGWNGTSGLNRFFNVDINYAGSVYGNDYWASVYTMGHGNTIISNSRIHNSPAYGIFECQDSGSVVVSNTEFDHNALSRGFANWVGSYGLASGSSQISNSNFHDNASVGVMAESGSISIVNSKFSNNTDGSILVRPDVPFIHSGNTESGSGKRGIIIGTDMMMNDQVWNGSDFVYVVNSISINNATLTLDPGTIIKLSGLTASVVVTGNIQANGTADKPVYITSIKDDTVGGDTNGDGAASTPAPGDGGTIVFGNTSFPGGGILNHLIIRYGGGDRSAGSCAICSPANIFVAKGGVTINNSQISFSKSFGVYEELSSSAVSITSSEIDHNKYGYGGYGTATITGTSIHDNTYAGIYNGLGNLDRYNGLTTPTLSYEKTIYS